MARNVSKDSNALPPELIEGGSDQQPGGIENPEPQVMDATEVIQTLAPEAPPVDVPEPDAPRAKRWLVTSSPESIVYEGGRVQMRVGKEYDEGCVDLDLLRRQGVVLVEIEG